MKSLVGQTLNRYQIISLLGEGGMGAVYKSHDLTLQRDVAIKIMHSHFARQPNFRERFLQEARSAARLNHPSIVQVHDFGQARSLLYIVMEFIPGDNLEMMLRSLRAKDEWIFFQESIGLVRHLSLALDYAHRQGVLHRDIKPGNIMLVPEAENDLPYRPVLTDLGLAKLITGGMVTQEGTSMGTPAYMSPEQCLGEEIDARSDVYSLGILLFELATGQLPFPASTISEAIKYHVLTLPPKPRSIQPDLPENLQKTILKAIEKDPSKRFSSAGEFANSLQNQISDTLQNQFASTTLLGNISLITKYQESLMENRGTSIFDIVESPAESTEDHIQIINPDRSTQTIQAKEVITIGRDPENDITIDDPKASRRHIRIEYNEPFYQVIDLNSTNGTYLVLPEKKKLIPGISTIWQANTPLLIGDTWFRLLPKEKTLEVQADIPTTKRIPQFDPKFLHTSAVEGHVALYIETTQLSVNPGQSVTIPLTIINQSANHDNFQVFVSGMPATWMSIPADFFSIGARDQRQSIIRIHPPHSEECLAGEYQISIRIISQSTSAVAEAGINITINSFTIIESQIQPQTIKPEHKGRLLLRNSGNNPTTLIINFQDQNNQLQFTPKRVQLQLDEGQKTVKEFQVQLKKKVWIGSKQNIPFKVNIKTKDNDTFEKKASFIVTPLLPIWIIPLFLFFCLAITTIISLTSGGMIWKSKNATRTAQAFQTSQAYTLLGTEVGGTETALALLGANQSTQDAATQTAAWLQEDDDRDGLTNAQELELGTKIDKRDTDEDGLDDGEEVNHRNTDPLNADTDGDGISDGEEVSQGLDPLNPDTDGDGILDPQDAAPLQTSTATLDIGATQQLAATLTSVSLSATSQMATTKTAQAQAASVATAAKMTAFAQTAIAQTASANATAQAATLTAASAKPVAYIYSTDISTGQNFESTMLPWGYKIDLIMHGNVLSTNFSSYSLIMIGHETGSNADWGDPPGDQAQHLATSGKPILGLGEGGYAFFGRLNLLIGYGKGAHGTGKDIFIVDPVDAIWNDPNDINIPGDLNISLYDSNCEVVSIFFPDPVMGTQPLGRDIGSANHYPLITQAGPFFLWGFDDGPASMSNKGLQVFENVLSYLVP